MSHRLSERDVARRAAGDAGRATAVRSQRGAGLIEVMVAIVVLSVGLLAIVLSQLNALRGQRSSHLRTAAAQMAGNMAERMRLNVASVNGSSGDYADPANHHTDSNYLRCRVAATGLACPGWPVAGVAVPLTVGDPFSTGPVDSLWTPVKPTEYLDRAEGKLYFPIAKLGQSTLADVGVLCADLVNKQSCGFFKTGSAMSFGSQTLFNGLGTTDDGRMLMFQHGYRQPDSASRIHCFDLKRKQACAGQPYLHAAYQPDSNLDTWNLASVTHGRYTFLAYNGQPQAALMSCWDNVANASCPGFGLKAMASGSRSFMTGVLPKLDATGQLIGACFTSTAACWDVEGRTIRVEAGSNFAYWLAYRPSWPTANQVYVTRKTQVYNFSDGYKKILCYDFATGNFCFNDTSVLSTAPDIVTASSGEFYAVTEDPERPGCVWALGDSSIGVVWDATNGGPCVQKIVKYTINTAPVDYYGFDKTINGEVDYKKIVIGNLPASHVDPNPANGVRATVWAIDADGASVKVVDNQPLVAPSSTQADYVLDLAPYVKSGVAPAKPLTYKNYPRLRTEITIHRAFGSVTWPNDSRADVIWSGPAIQFGVQTRAPANDSLSCLRETFVQSGVFVANSTLAGKTAATTAASNALVERQASASSGPAMLESSFLGYRRKNPEAGEGVPTVAMYAFFDNNLFSGNIGLFDVTSGTAGAATPTSTKLADLHGLTGLRAGTRRAFTSNADGQTVALQWSLLDDAWKDALDRNRGGIKDKAGVDRLAYLRGDRSNEIGRSTGKGLFHPRSDRGTLCDSNGACLFAFKSTEVPDPGTMTGTGLALMLPGVLSGYSEALAPGYSAFQKQSRDKVDGRPSGVLFANSNDGFLYAHGIRAGTGSDLGTLSLTETFVYLPRRLRTLMSGYTDRSVLELGTFPALNDGAPLLADFCRDGCTSAATAVWRTALVSSFGRGFPGGFAVDVTDAGKTGKDGVQAMWEFSEQTPVAKASAQPDPALYLGRQSAFPMSSYSNASMSTQVVRVKVGAETRWAWVIGNGQGSAAAHAAGITLANDTAVLYLVFMDGAKAGTPQYVGLKLPGIAGKANGLSTPNPVDVTGDGTADLVYAGDLQGRMWRIDLSELDLEKGLPNNAAKVVMEAANSKGIVQPVVGAPAVVQVGNSSRMVVFASGRPEVTSARYLDSTGSLYSLIGVKDDFKPGELPQTTPPPPRSSCARRSLGAEVPLQIKIKVGPNKPEAVRAAAARGIAGDPMANEKCWAVDLGSGETGIGNAVHNPVGRAVELLSIESPSAANGCRAGRSWINRINALTGKPVGVDVDGDGMIGSDEGAYGGLAIGRSTAIAVNNGKNVATGNASNPANAQGGSGVIAPNTGRIWWREL